MDKLSSRWRKPKGRSSKKSKLASMKALARWKQQSSCGTPCLDNDQQTLHDCSDAQETLQDFSDAQTHSVLSEIKQTRTEKKFSSSENYSLDTQLQGSAYSIVHDNVWSDLLKNLSCEQCLKKDLNVISLNEFGYSSKLQLYCKGCNTVFGSTFSSPRLPGTRKFELNKNIVEAFLNIGKGHSAMESFSISLGIPTMDRKTFDNYVLRIVEEGKK